MHFEFEYTIHMRVVDVVDQICEICSYQTLNHKWWHCVMDRLQTSGELQDKTSFIDPSTGVGLLKGCSPDYLFL
jgi:hypothetical protein